MTLPFPLTGGGKVQPWTGDPLITLHRQKWEASPEPCPEPPGLRPLLATRPFKGVTGLWTPIQGCGGQCAEARLQPPEQPLLVPLTGPAVLFFQMGTPSRKRSTGP